MFGWIRSLGIVVLAIMAAEVRAQGPGSNAKVITWGPVGNTGEIYVGILGEIAKPGVYRLEASALNLPSMIHRSGGLTGEASGSIRVIRQDRIVENIFYSPRTTVALLPGDLLVVESKQLRAVINSMYNADPSRRPQSVRDVEGALKSDPSGVQVAFINVLDRPVVVKIKHENARLGQVVQMLDQPLELAQSVRVIGPERLLSQSATPQSIDTSISDGTVLWFPRNSVNRNKLPVLPLPYDSEIASGAIPSLIGGPSGQSPELRNVGQLPPMIARHSGTAIPSLPPANIEHGMLPTPPTAIASPFAISPPSAERVNVSPQAPIVGSRPRIATTLPFTGQPRITSSSSHVTDIDSEPQQPAGPERSGIAPEQSDRSTSSQSSRPRDARGYESGSGINDESLDDSAAPNLETSKSSSLSFGQMFGIAACIGLLVGLAMLTRRYFEEQVVSAPSLDMELATAGHHQAATAMNSVAEITAAEITAAEITAAEITAAEITVAENAAAEITEPSRQAIESRSPMPPSAPPVVSRPVEAVAAITEQPTDVAPPVVLWFDHLLGNQIPILEERAEFPHDIALQGRIISPPVFRVDDAAKRTIQGPHFAAVRQPEQSEPPVRSKPTTAVPSQRATERVIGELDMPHKDGPGRPHFMRRPAGKNTVAAAAASVAAAKGPSAELKQSDTPVTDALRHLQGGQP